MGPRHGAAAGGRVRFGSGSGSHDTLYRARERDAAAACNDPQKWFPFGREVAPVSAQANPVAPSEPPAQARRARTYLSVIRLIERCLHVNRINQTKGLQMAVRLEWRRRQSDSRSATQQAADMGRCRL